MCTSSKIFRCPTLPCSNSLRLLARDITLQGYMTCSSSSASERDSNPQITSYRLSGWHDSNVRPPDPKSGILTGLKYIPIIVCAQRGNRTLTSLDTWFWIKRVYLFRHPGIVGIQGISPRMPWVFLLSNMSMSDYQPVSGRCFVKAVQIYSVFLKLKNYLQLFNI